MAISITNVFAGATATIADSVVEFIKARKGGVKIKLDARKAFSPAELLELADALKEVAAMIPAETPEAEDEPATDAPA